MIPDAQNVPAMEPRGYLVDDLRVDVGRRSVARGDSEIPLPTLSFDLLLALVRAAPDVLTYDQLMRCVWRNVVVNQETVTQRVKLLRDAIGDDSHHPRYIAGVRGRGYRMLALVQALPPASAAHHRIPSSEPPETARARRAWWLVAAISGLILVGGALVYQWRESASTAVAERTSVVVERPRTIAVMPFVNVGGDPDNDYFSDGLSEELLHVLAGIQDLKVAGRSSSFYFKGKIEQPQTIGRMLGVDHLLEGSVRREGRRVRITARLIDARSGYQVMTQTYDRELDHVFAIQEDIARSVAGSLRVRLMPADEARVARRGTESAEAHRLYLIARGKYRERGLANLRTAKVLFERAIEHDPRYAAAYAGLASTYFLLINNHGEELKEGEQRAREAVERALALNPSSSEALVARANVEFRFRRGDGSVKSRALADLRRAMHLDPRNANAFAVYAGLTLFDDPERSLRFLERALELDPLERIFLVTKAQHFWVRGRYAEARAQFQEAMRRHPDYDGAFSEASLFAHEVGDLVEAYALRIRSYELAPEAFKAFVLYRLSSDLGNAVAAEHWLSRINGSPLFELRREVVRLVAAKRHREALALLESVHEEARNDLWIVLAAAHWSLVLGEPERAAAHVTESFPHLVGEAPEISFFTCDASLALAAAWQRAGREENARRLLEKIAGWLDGPEAVQYPSRLVARAQVHALLDHRDDAIEALNRAYDAGYRYTNAGSYRGFAMEVMDYPLYANLRGDPRFVAWIGRIRADNARQRAILLKAGLGVPGGADQPAADRKQNIRSDSSS